MEITDIHRLVEEAEPPFLAGHHKEGSDNAPGHAADTADHDDEQDIVGQLHREGRRRYGAEVHGQQRPADAGKEGADNKGHLFMLGKVDTHGLRGDFIFTDGFEGTPVRRAEKHHYNENAETGNDKRRIERGETGDHFQPQRAVGNGIQRRTADGDTHNLGEAQRRDGEVVALQAKNRRADEQSKESGNETGNNHRHRYGQSNVGQSVIDAVEIVNHPFGLYGNGQHSENVSTDGHKSRLPQGKQPGKTVQQVHGNRHQGVNSAELQNRSQHRRTGHIIHIHKEQENSNGRNQQKRAYDFCFFLHNRSHFLCLFFAEQTGRTNQQN